MQGLQEGQGTAGKLLKDPALYDEAHKTIAGPAQAGGRSERRQGHRRQAAQERRAAQPVVGYASPRSTSMLDKVNSGQGTIGQLLVNQQLYDNLNGATREMHLLMKDFRANPKKFLRIKLGLFNA